MKKKNKQKNMLPLHFVVNALIFGTVTHKNLSLVHGLDWTITHFYCNARLCALLSETIHYFYMNKDGLILKHIDFFVLFLLMITHENGIFCFEFSRVARKAL